MSDLSRPSVDIDQIIGNASIERKRIRVLRSRLALAVSLGVTLLWLVWVVVRGHGPRVVEHWVSAVTMVFGSFVAGATPQGGGAVAFPVFTKVLEVPASVARSFSLTIQSVGMGAASLSIIINRRAVSWRALFFAVPGAAAGFSLGVLFLLSDSEPFGPSVLPGPFVKVGFTLLVSAMALVTWIGYRDQIVETLERLPKQLSLRLRLALFCSGLLGGGLSSLVGSGTDVCLYVCLVIFAGLRPKVGIATSVLAMTFISWLGLVYFAVFEGHLAVALGDLGDVASVNARPVSLEDGSAAFRSGGSLPSGQFDLFGLWLAAVPVVVWGAPLGSFVSSRLTDRRLVAIVVVLAAVELVSTAVFVDELRSDVQLVVFLVGGLLVLSLLLAVARRLRRSLLGLPGLRADVSITRSHTDLGGDYLAQAERWGSGSDG